MIVEPGKTTQYDLMVPWAQVGGKAVLVPYSTDIAFDEASRQALADPRLQVFRTVVLRTRIAPRLTKPK